MIKRVLSLFVFTGLCLTFAGCGDSGVEVDGKMVKGGAPVPIAEGEAYKITLTGEDGKTGGVGDVGADGNFKIMSTEGKPIPFGKYKVSYMHYPPPPKDVTKGQPPPVTKSTSEVWDVSATNKSFTLDIGKK